MHWRHYLRIRTRTPAFLWKMVFGILLAGLVLGFVVQWIVVRSNAAYIHRLGVAASQGSSNAPLSTLDEMLADRDLPLEELLDALAVLARPQSQPKPGELFPLALPMGEPIPPQEVTSRLAASLLERDTKSIAIELWHSLAASELSKDLSQLAERRPPVRFANQAVGVYCEARETDTQAAAAYEREGQFPDAKVARQRAVAIYSQENDVEAVKRLAADPRYDDDVPAYARMQVAAEARDWWSVWWLVPVNEWQRLSFGAAALAIFTGCCWFVFCVQAGQVGAARGARWWMCGLAVLLGGLSIWPTHLLILWQEIRWGLVESADLTAGIRYFVLGVGLREELSKLLLLVPLAPLLARRGNELEALIVAAYVGLGFAVMENSHYFRATLGSSSIGRFLTANFFHMAATGLIGLAVVRGLREPRTRGLEALAIFGVIVFAHGLYDAAIALPALAEYSVASMIIYILLAYQFFRELRGLRIRRQETISLTATFLCGVSLITAVTFVYLSGQLGCRMAAVLLVPEILATALLVIMFLREVPGSLMSI